MRKAVEVAARVNAKWCTVVPGQLDPGLEWEYQTANVVENLKRAAAILEPAGLVAVLEPLNHWTNQPRRVPDRDSAGVPDLQGGRLSFGQESSTTSTTSRSPRGT